MVYRYLVFMSKIFNELTRVQIPAILHLEKLGYTFVPKGDIKTYDHNTNILTDVFITFIKRLNPELTDPELDSLLKEVIRKTNNDDLGREVYKMLSSKDSPRLIDFDKPDNNDWCCTAEFTCKNEESGDEFRPDITCFINGLPLCFIEVKVPNNHDGILAERERMNKRMQNPKFRRFLNLTQLMIFSNNQEYDNENRVPVQGAFYASITRGKIFFNVFREQTQAFYDNLFLDSENESERERKILRAFNKEVLVGLPEYNTNKKPTTPTNRVISSLLSKERILFLLRYGFAYVDKKFELENGETTTKLEKHVMRYQQLFASLNIRKKLDEGGKSGIIWHTQGSGKTALAYYSVKSLTDFLSKKGVVAKFYFIVDRIDLMEQAKEEFVARNLLVRTADSKEELMRDFQNSISVNNSSGQLEIMVVNIQKFEENESVDLPNSYNINLQRIFFIDEAHRGYNPKGSFLANLLEADKDAIKIALTGTPLIKEERASWKIFGDYIDRYYYDKSIADGYTLKLMREDIETTYKERLLSLLDVAQKEAMQVKAKDFDQHKVIESDNYLNALLDYVIKDLKEFRIQKEDKTVGGMIVCETNHQARKLMELFQKRNNESESMRMSFVYEGLAAEVIPFYGKKLKAELILHDEGDRETRKIIIERFKKTTEIDILIVNKMLLTGFDANRLKRMYLTRKLNGHDLLQALTRVNRPYHDFKYGYVVDFAGIQDNFEATNDEYLRELNRCCDTDETKDENGNAHEIGSAILEDKEIIKNELAELKSVLFAFTCDNVEEFSNELDDLNDRTRLYEVRRVLENAKAISNQVRSYGDAELKSYFSSKLNNIGSIPELLSVVNKRIDRLNQIETISHSEDVSDVVNSILAQIEYSFECKGKSELVILNNEELRDKALKLMQEVERNFDHHDPQYVNLLKLIQDYFKKKHILAENTQEFKDCSAYLDDMTKQIEELNKKNKILMSKYKEDDKYMRVHKRIVEANQQRVVEHGQPIIANEEYKIAESLNELKADIDEMILLNTEIVNGSSFDQAILSIISKKLLDLHIDATIADRKFLRDQIVSEYSSQLQSLR